ncbi:DUF177 domain-containing protein [Ruminococcus sp. Marseille-P6503]|uniref:YceD family protein n=1 Tax=Ruminococcus sp. Marseille-P6503 TaxID=2364796 RepID=UPI000F52ED1F|nr:DUF177 domain-containing protein [Ruminococcus sp. Marseille-P6503]
MILQLKQLFDIVGEVKDFSFEISPEEINEAQFSADFVTPLSVSGRAENRAGVVAVRLSCVFTLSHVCDRCLKEFEREYSFEFSHILVQSSNTRNDEYVVCSGNTLDINELAISDLLLQLPTKILCREDCKGLCYVCGHDLNEGECNCS